MSTGQHGEDAHLTEFEQALRVLVPQSSPDLHDRLMFAAGQQAERVNVRSTRRLWMASTGVSTAAAVVLAFFLGQSRSRVSQLELALNKTDSPTVVESSFGTDTTEPASQAKLSPVVVANTSAGSTVGWRVSDAVPLSRSQSAEVPRYLEWRSRVLRSGGDVFADREFGAAKSASGTSSIFPHELRRMYLTEPDSVAGSRPAG